MFSWGDISAAQVQKLAFALQKDLAAGDALDLGMVQRFAEMGNYGERHQNIERDLHQRITGINLPDPRAFPIPAKYDGEPQKDAASILRAVRH